MHCRSQSVMEHNTPRRSLNGAATRFPGIGAVPPSGYEASGSHPSPPTARGARTDDELHLERWRETMRAQDEEQALLHQTVVSSKKQQLESQHERLAKQRAFIRHEKRKLLLQNALLDSEKERFDASLTSDWFCLSAFPTVHDRRITLDVGGQLFEISSHVALKDPNSMLAAFVADDSPLSMLECGCFRVDRDWWLFRYVLHFLRDGLLPPDPKLLRELYIESEFWKIDSLRKAIEMKNMELLQIKQESDAKAAAAAAATLLSTTPNGKSAHAKYHLDSALLTRMKSSSMLPEHKTRDPHAWWLEAPSWWGEPKLASVAAALKRAEEEKAAAVAAAAKGGEPTGHDDTWWKTVSYKGKDFNQILTSEKKKAEDDGSGTPRSPLVLSSTWPSAHG
ncbi:hypothetical protein Poli38472_007596 [Pythium oligandrum]|uniref:BTB domain-containing protein n=1 Tax=Pythium oligandrum TaxID=41045 RepID=A0A8K1CRI1_PYTOL|nr:hypothetical protein Poli38472_007596 [Pythium oligandrum]|eukprot:TMW67924.1 hypothetical protein Poli38472_007596 [Pythium oligandrum]